MPCSNAAGTHKRSLLVSFGKSANPRAFKGYKIPVVNRATNKGWMSTSLFFDWFKNHFIPEVKEFLTQVNIKALFILDNAASYPKTGEISFDPNFKVMFLPMDQNVIQNVKVTYRKQ